MANLDTSKKLLFVVVLCFGAAIVSSAQTFTTLVNFNGANGANPDSILIQASDGKLYGTTSYGGAYGMGTIFRMTPTGTLTAIYSFDYTHGAYPHSGVIQATDGNFYGTTSLGGANGWGTVYRITPNGNLTTLHSFNVSDGSYPNGLLQAVDGNLYGTTYGGGITGPPHCNSNISGCGTVFKLSLSGSLTTLYSFDFNKGANPEAGLIQATDGNLYGTTFYGGTNSIGVIFGMTPMGIVTGVFSLGFATGGNPEAEVIQATDGNLYGTNFYGGGAGTVFRYGIPSGALTVLHSFTGVEGSNPDGLMQGTDSNFYGTTYGGGASNNCSTFRTNGCGAIFQITPMGVLTSLHSFDANGGANPQAGLLQATDGNFYGTTWGGGPTNNNCASTHGCGTVFALSLAASMPLAVFTVGTGIVKSTDGYINCGTRCYQSYFVDSKVVLTGTPSQGWALTGWNGCDKVTANVCSVSTYQARSVTATFKLTYAVSASTSGNGTIISGDGYINCGSACSHNYPSGTTLALAATPAVGSTLSHWTGCTSTPANYCIVTINGPTSVSATFSPVQISFGSLVFNPSTARHTGIAVGTLTFTTPTPSGGVTLRLTSNHPDIVVPPSLLYVPGGLTAIRFGAHVLGVRPTSVAITATDGTTFTSGTLNVTPASSTPVSARPAMLNAPSNSTATPSARPSAMSATPNSTTSVSTRPAAVKQAPPAKSARQAAAPRKAPSVE